MVHVNNSMMDFEDVSFDHVRIVQQHVASLSKMLSECEQLIEATTNGEAWEEQFLDATTMSRTRVDSDEVVDTTAVDGEDAPAIWLQPEDLSSHAEKLTWLLRECDDTYDQLQERSQVRRRPERTHSFHPINPQLLSDKHWLVSCMDVGLFALFGGQGYYLLSELKSLYNDAELPELRGIIASIGETLREEASICSSPQWAFKYGFDLESWLKDDRCAPDKWYLYSAPVSYPLVMLLQLCRYIQTLRRLDTKHEEFISRLRGATGHSQGVVSALVLSMSRNEAELVDNMTKAAKYLLYQGLRCYEALVTCAACPFNENEPYKYSPMLAVKGLKPSVLDGIVQITLKRLHEFDNANHKMNVSIVNGPTLCVVSGQSNALLELQKTIAHFDAKNLPRSDPAKKRPRVKYSTSTAFLSVGAAFHSPINQTVVADIIQDAKRVGFVPSKLRIPVYHSETGDDLTVVEQDQDMLLRQVVEMQAVRSFDFRNTLKHVRYENTRITHILDFGPSDGTAKLCAGLKKEEDLLIIATGGATASRKTGDGALVGLESMLARDAPLWKSDLS